MKNGRVKIPDSNRKRGYEPLEMRAAIIAGSTESLFTLFRLAV
jgi:hypothetical protein